MTNKPLKKLIQLIPQDTYLFASNTDNSSVLEALITENKTAKNNLSKFGKHLSPKMFINIPNFEEALLNPKALTPEVRDTLKKLFKAFNDIPVEFTECDVKKSHRYIKQHGNPHYFEDPNAPFQPHFTTPHKRSYKNNLAILRRARQRRCQKD